MLEELILDAKKRDHYYFFAYDQGKMNKEIQDFFRVFDNLNVKYTSFPTLSNLSICNDKIAFIIWSKISYGILIGSRVLFKSYVKFFNFIYTSLPNNNKNSF